MPLKAVAAPMQPPAAGLQVNARVLRALDAGIFALILLNVAASIVGTMAEVEARFGQELAAFETFSVGVFTAEYAARLWTARRRVRYALSPLALIDLIAIVPFYLPFLGADLRFARAFRLLRLLRIAKLARYLRAVHLFCEVARAKREELVMAAAGMSILLICASSLMYFAEHDAQPQAFSSIPASMWWSVATVTTVGYGDVFPVTPLGRLVAGVVAVLGIGFFAFPTAILSAGFVEVVSRSKVAPTCPHCGGPLP